RQLAGAQLAAYLKQVDLTKFHPEEAPMTRGKQAMISAANPELEWLDDQFSDEGAYHNRKVVVINDVLGAWHRHAECTHNKGITLNSVRSRLSCARLSTPPGRGRCGWALRARSGHGCPRKPWRRGSTSAPPRLRTPTCNRPSLGRNLR